MSTALAEVPHARVGELVAPRGGIPVRQRGAELIASPLLNKGTAFSFDEREAFGLRGLLPPHVATIEEQVALEVEHVRRKTDDLEQYIGLAALQDRNETLFYRVLASNLAEFMPIVYTPTVGRACKEFSHIFRRPRGVWITPADVGRMDAILLGAAPNGVRLLVVTDNERILGLGDQGAGGMSIPVGKLALYTAGAGIYPAQTLPVSLDVGTDNETLLEDSLYLGYRAPRLRGAAYDDVLEAFVEAVARVFPGAIVQWEDFKQHNALRVLARYRHRLPSFNDDVQGTGGVTLAGLLTARASRGGLAGERILFLGAGAAALGIARMVSLQLALEGVAADEIRDALALMDSKGLLHEGREVADDQLAYRMPATRMAALGLDDASSRDPVAVARAVQPTILIGTTGTPGAFSEALVREVASHDPEPIILPLTNPGDKCEARPEQILAWTDGRALVASGSPFPPVDVPGRGIRTIAQANNVFVFPGIGLGAIVAGAREITDEAFIVAAHELTQQVTPERLAEGGLYPPIDELRAASRRIAIAVVRHFRDTGYGRHLHDDEIESAVDRAIWWPEYLPYDPA